MKKILVLDDNEDILELILMILEMEGYQMKGIRAGAELAAAVAEFKPDLILLDVLLGDSDGRVLCNELKLAPSTASIPIVMISASHAAMSLPQDFQKPDDFISKPFDIQNLVARVQAVLDRSVLS
ncbi:MAG: response regulator [Pedobacter sp.]|nr:MAG: response regulator [Pedobacter sp.]